MKEKKNLLTFLAEFSGVSFDALALAFYASSSSWTICNFALVVTKAAFFAFPTRMALAFTILVFTVATAKHWTGS